MTWFDELLALASDLVPFHLLAGPATSFLALTGLLAAVLVWVG